MIMDTAQYPRIGSYVKYLRADETGKIFTGSGNVRGIFLDPNDRVMVQVKDKDQAYNVDLYGINPTKASRASYKNLIDQVQEITKEGNVLVQKTVESYNTQVMTAYTELLGAPIHADEPLGTSDRGQNDQKDKEDSKKEANA